MPVVLYSGTVGSPVSFDGSGSTDSDGSIVSYEWIFGDGSSGTGVSPSHTYATDDTFTVTLTVNDDDGGADTDSTIATIDPIPDVTAPVITLLGSTPVDVELGTSYTDAGATASDNIDGDLTTSIVTRQSG